MTDRPGYDFWTHEYEKHGTCAESLPGTLGFKYNEQKFFGDFGQMFVVPG